MENTPRLSSSVKSSVDSSPRTPFSIDQSLFQSPSRKHPMEVPNSPPPNSSPPNSSPPNSLPSNSSPPNSPPSQFRSPKAEGSVFRRRTIEANRRMRRMYTPYKLHTSANLPEMRFAMRSLGRTSHTSLTLEDVVEVS